MARYICGSCGYCYFEDCGVKFEDLPADYVCPKCGTPAACFRIAEADKKIYKLGFIGTTKLFFRSIFGKNKKDKPVLNIGFSFNVKNLIAACVVLALWIIYSICFFGTGFCFDYSPEALITTYIGCTVTHIILILFCFLRIGKFDFVSKQFGFDSVTFLLSCIILRAVYSTIIVLVSANNAVAFLPVFIFEMWWNIVAIPLTFITFFNIYRKGAKNFNENLENIPKPKKPKKQKKNKTPPKKKIDEDDFITGHNTIKDDDITKIKIK